MGAEAPLADNARFRSPRDCLRLGRAGEGLALVLDSDGNIRAAWDTFMETHGFEGVTPHVLRHTRITLLLQAGVPVWDVSALVGASPDVIHAVYGHHVTDDRLPAQADRRETAA